MASILCLGFALVVALSSGVDAQTRRCTSFPRDTCPVGFYCVNGYCEDSSGSLPCRFSSDCPDRRYECVQRRCVRRFPPQDCRLDPSICLSFETCNRFTGRCEIGTQDDCRRNPSICGPFQTCNFRTGRCESNDCRSNPSICGPFETCNFRTGRCESSTNDCRIYPCPFGQTCQFRFGSYQCVSDYCRPFPAQDCPPGFYCRRGECVRDFLGASGSTSGGAPAGGTESTNNGSGM